MKTRIRWEGKVRICEYRQFFRWREAYREDFSHKPSGYPAIPPFRVEKMGLFGTQLLVFPWHSGDFVP